MVFRCLLLAAALLVVPINAGLDEAKQRLYLEPVDFDPFAKDYWPAQRAPMPPSMQDAFDRAAKKWLYRKECRCLIWAGSESGIVKRAGWPPTDGDRWGIIEDIRRGFFIPPRRSPPAAPSKGPPGRAS